MLDSQNIFLTNPLSSVAPPLLCYPPLDFPSHEKQTILSAYLYLVPYSDQGQFFLVYIQSKTMLAWNIFQLDHVCV